MAGVAPILSRIGNEEALQFGDNVLGVQIGKRKLKLCPVLVDGDVVFYLVVHLPIHLFQVVLESPIFGGKAMVKIKAVANDVKGLTGHEGS
jgi:hypothetical protein